MQASPAQRPLRVAILGLGPKGLFALERLLDGLSAAGPGPALAISIFEPHPAPGAGPVYDPSQPDFLRMNLAADGVDLWRLPNQAVPADRQPSFVEWRRRRGVGSQHEDFPPRSHVGRYLADCCDELLTSVPARSSLTVHSAPADRISAKDGCWHVEAGEFTASFEEVLLSAGHQDSWHGALRNGWSHAAHLVAAVYPVDRALAGDAIPPGATVAVRGFGLTFLDAALALTEGRGGDFRPVENSPWRLTYVPAGSEAPSILPFSRTGETMLAKADRSIVTSIGALDDIAETGKRDVRDLTSADPAGELLAIIADTARALLLEKCDGVDAERISRQAEEWLAAPAPAAPGSRDVARELEQSLRVAAGETPPGLEWALAQSWLLLLPAVVERMGGEALDQSGWITFRSLARKMERIAFGPPAINAAKLLALIEAGVVDLGHLDGGRLADRDPGQGTELISAGGGRSTVDVVVDAVMPEPGVRGSHAGVLSELLDSGRIRVREGRRGLDVAEDGTCLDSDGRPSIGLSAIGRPTEDSVIDNDTLSRTLHRHSELWARRVLTRARTKREEPSRTTT